MFRNFMLKSLMVLVLAATALSVRAAEQQNVSATRSLNGAAKTVDTRVTLASGSYIVWYMAYGRWHGSGPYYNYYDACTVYNQLVANGVQAYIDAQ